MPGNINKTFCPAVFLAALVVLGDTSVPFPPAACDGNVPNLAYEEGS